MVTKQRTRRARSSSVEDRGSAKRSEILERLADHVLATGLDAASLRPLAAAVGTSDRMLLYYFPDKATLVTSILDRIVERLASKLSAEMPPQGALTPAEMLRTVWQLLRRPALRPYMQVWLELAGHAARGEEPHRTIGRTIAEAFIEWIASRLDVPTRNTRAEAAAVLIQIEGLLLLDAYGVPLERVAPTGGRGRR